MRRILAFLWICLISLSANAQPPQGENLYVGTFTSEGAEGVYWLKFNPETGDLRSFQTMKGIDNPNFMKRSPDGQLMYIVGRSPGTVDATGGFVNSYRIGARGELRFLGKQTSHGGDPCYVDVSPDGKWVALANYGGGSIAIYPVGENGALLSATAIIRHQGSGPNISRQKEPHAHSIRFSLDGSRLYAADLGTDQLLVYQLDRELGTLTPASQPYVAMPPGSGPRHFEFSRDEKYAYVANELTSTVTVIENTGTQFQVVQTISALSDDYAGTSYCADIHLSPDEKYVYVSNRGHQSIAVFERLAEGRLKLVKHVGVEGNWPRNFTIHSSGKYMLVANQRSHNITVFEMKDGIPVYTGKQLKVPAAVCLQF